MFDFPVLSNVSNPHAGALRLANIGGVMTLLDASGERKEVATQGDGAHAGAPVEALAASYTTGLTGTNNDLVITARKAGAGLGLSVAYVDPGVPNATLAIAAGDGNGETFISLATDAGEKALASVGDVLSVEYPDAGPVDHVLDVVVGTSEGISCSFDGGNLTVGLVTDAGTGASGMLEESSDAYGDAGKVEITSTDVGAANNGFRVETVVPIGNANSVLELSIYSNVLTISLPVDENGDVVPTSADDIATAINESTLPFSASEETAGYFGSYNSVVLSDGVDPVVLTDGRNSATNVAAAIEAQTDFRGLVSDGDVDVPVGRYEFSGGGANPEIITTAGDIVALLAGSCLVSAVNAPGNNGTGVVTAMTRKELTGGVTGTLAWLGRLASDGTDVWFAKKASDGTVANVWKKLI